MKSPIVLNMEESFPADNTFVINYQFRYCSKCPDKDKGTHSNHGCYFPEWFRMCLSGSYVKQRGGVSVRMLAHTIDHEMRHHILNVMFGEEVCRKMHNIKDYMWSY